MILFNKPHITGKEIQYVEQALLNHSSGNGDFTKKCHKFFSENFGFRKCLLTTSCTDALELAALLCNVGQGDEVIIPSFTFVSTANAFLLRGAEVVFADSTIDHPNVSADSIRKLVNKRTKVIVVVHYAGVAVDMDEIMAIAQDHKLLVVEDAAQAINSSYKGRPLGGIGHLGCVSFHETKNIIAGEGGMLIVNDERFIERAEILWEKGTNRSAFIRGLVDKYGWVDIGSSFLPADTIAAFLFAQLEQLKEIHERRFACWNRYYKAWSQGDVRIPQIPSFATHNAHIFYILLGSLEKRISFIDALRNEGIQVHFHYPPLHLGKFYLETHRPTSLPNATYFFDCLVRLPVYPDLSETDQDRVIEVATNVLRKLGA